MPVQAVMFCLVFGHLGTENVANMKVNGQPIARGSWPVVQVGTSMKASSAFQKQGIIQSNINKQELLAELLELEVLESKSLDTPPFASLQVTAFSGLLASTGLATLV